MLVGGHRDDDLAQRRAERQLVQGGQGETSIPFALARATSWSACPAQTYRSATIGEPIASTGLMLLVAGRRQYRQGASKLMRSIDHQFQRRIDNRPRFFGIEVLFQFSGALDVREQRGDRLPLAVECSSFSLFGRDSYPVFRCASRFDGTGRLVRKSDTASRRRTSPRPDSRSRMTRIEPRSACRIHRRISQSADCPRRISCSAYLPLPPSIRPTRRAALWRLSGRRCRNPQ